MCGCVCHCFENKIYLLWGEVLYVHVLMRDEKEERSKHGQTNNKAKQYSTPEAVTFPKKNELPRVGLEPTTLYTLPLSYQGSSAGWA